MARTDYGGPMAGSADGGAPPRVRLSRERVLGAALGIADARGRRALTIPALTAHAYAVLDSYVYGFALQEASLPFEGSGAVGEAARPIVEAMATGRYPHLLEMATGYYLQPGYDFADEFRFGLDLLLDGLARKLASATG